MPEAILLQDVETLGEQGKVIEVSKGYLRNYLLPRKLAEPATKGSIEAATRMDREGILKRAQFESLYQRLFQVRDGIIVLMGELRAEWRRRYGT